MRVSYWVSPDIEEFTNNRGRVRRGRLVRYLINRPKGDPDKQDLYEENCKCRYRKRYLPCYSIGPKRGQFKSGLGTLLKKDGSPQVNSREEAHRKIDAYMNGH